MSKRQREILVTTPDGETWSHTHPDVCCTMVEGYLFVGDGSLEEDGSNFINVYAPFSWTSADLIEA